MKQFDKRSRAIVLIGLIIFIIGAIATIIVRVVIVELAKRDDRLTLNVGSGAAVIEAYSQYSGLPITKQQAKQRAIGVMIASDPVTRPQSGLSEADIVVEMEAAPGITRLLAIFQSSFPEEIGSIRSARNDYIDISAGFDAALVHWGGEKRALDRLANSNTAEIDQFANGDLFYRKLTVPSPHNGFATGDDMKAGLERFGYDRAPTFDEWIFKDDVVLEQRPLSGVLDLSYGNVTFDVEYNYDRQKNSYLRSQGGLSHGDANTGEQLSAKNVLVLRADRFVYSQQGGYLQFDFSVGGECSLFQNGGETDCTWSKGSGENDPISVVDSAGQDVEFVRGITWIQVLTPSADVQWTTAQNSGSIEQHTP